MPYTHLTCFFKLCKQVECVGDDIAWMRFNKKTGMLHGMEICQHNK